MKSPIKPYVPIGDDVQGWKITLPSAKKYGYTRAESYKCTIDDEGGIHFIPVRT